MLRSLNIKKDARNNAVYNLRLNHRFYDVICKFQTEMPFIVKAKRKHG